MPTFGAAFGGKSRTDKLSDRGLRWLLPGLSLLLALPALVLANPFGTDGPVHIRWQIAFTQAFWGGHLFPRWLPEMNHGFGSPAFFFYPPLLQGLAALFAPLLPGDGAAIRRLACALAVMLLVAAQGCRLWMRALGLSERAGLLTGALWLVAPYRAFVDTYQRCALAECVSLCLLPWLGYCAVRLGQGWRGAWGWHALAVGALAYAHLPGMVVGYLFCATHGLALVLCQGAGRRWPLLLALGSSALAGVALGGAMLVPALGLLGFIVNPAAMSGARNQPHNWLLFSGKAWIDPVAMAMTLGVVILTLVLCATLARPAADAPVARARGVVWAMVAVVVAVSLLNTRLSLPFWEWQTPISRIQFPFRLLGASSLAVCVLAGLAHDGLRAKGRAGQAAALWLLVLVLLAGNLGAFAYQRLRPRDSYPPAIGDIMADNEDTSEYVLGDLPGAEAYFGGRPAVVVPVPASPAAGTVRLGHVETGYRTVVADYGAGQSSALALRQFAFTGWTCRIDGGAWQAAFRLRLGTAPQAAQVPLCLLPAGTHRLEARLAPSAPERSGMWLSLAALAVVLMSCPLEAWCHRRRGSGHDTAAERAR